MNKSSINNQKFEQIASMLETTEGRIKLASPMILCNYQDLGKKLFIVEELPKGANVHYETYTYLNKDYKIKWKDGTLVSDYAISVHGKYLAEDNKRLAELMDKRRNSVRNSILELEV